MRSLQIINKYLTISLAWQSQHAQYSRSNFGRYKCGWSRLGLHHRSLLAGGISGSQKPRVDIELASELTIAIRLSDNCAGTTVRPFTYRSPRWPAGLVLALLRGVEILRTASGGPKLHFCTLPRILNSVSHRCNVCATLHPGAWHAWSNGCSGNEWIPVPSSIIKYFNIWAALPEVSNLWDQIYSSQKHIMDLGQLKAGFKEYKKYLVVVKAWPKDMPEN